MARIKVRFSHFERRGVQVDSLESLESMLSDLEHTVYARLPLHKKAEELKARLGKGIKPRYTRGG